MVVSVGSGGIWHETNDSVTVNNAFPTTNKEKRQLSKQNEDQVNACNTFRTLVS